MKRSIIALATGVILLGWLTSCDKLDEPYAVIKNTNDTTVTAQKTVLLEDYTGHKCVNCPDAAITAHTLEKSLKGRLIVMAVHAGFFAEPASTGDFTADYTTGTGDEWNSYFTITANPNGLVNRTAYNGALVVGPDNWANAVNAQLALDAEATVDISNEYTEATRNLEITVDTKFLEELSGAYTLTVCITEDSLISPQKTNNSTTPIIYDYVFMDVLRGSVNGTWGEELTASVNPSQTYKKTYTVTLNQAWTAKNCHVVAFVSNAETKEIIQTGKEPVIAE